MSIPCFIPSKDRAAQLLLLLDSLEKNAPGVFFPHIMYKASTENFEFGYEIVKKIYPNCVWKREVSSEKDFYGFLEFYSNILIGLFSDDCILFRPVGVRESDIRKIFQNEDVFSATLRLGQNITIKDYVRNEAAVVPLEQDYDHTRNCVYIVWDYTKIDFWQLHGFTVGFDGYIFRSQDLLDLSEKRSFSEDRICYWEQMICDQFRRKGSTRNMMASPYVSSVFVEQINVTHGLAHRSTRKFNISLESLNNELLLGRCIDLSSMDFSGVNCTHGEIPFTFKDL
jgi:hypothetical protein